MHFASGVTQTGGDLFQFPSNGKAYMHLKYGADLTVVEV